MGVVNVPSAPWTILGGRLFTPAPFHVAGIVNLTPDSFSDGGFYDSPASALDRVRQVLDEGAHMVDLGAESTRPGAEDIGEAEERRRLMPVLAETVALARRKDLPERNRGKVAVSVDTFRAGTAAAALALGADIINDVSGCSFEPALTDVLAEYRPGYVLGHSPARPAVMAGAARYTDVVDDLLRWFDQRMTMLVRAGVPETCICLDPCIGFGKNTAHSLEVLAGVRRFAKLGRPLYFGVSRKRFLREITGYATSDADMHTQVVTAFLALQGVRIHRVHDVRAACATLSLVQAMATGVPVGPSVHEEGTPLREKLLPDT